MRLLLFLLLLSIPRLVLAGADTSTEERYVVHYAVQYRVPPELIAALIDVESRWNPHGRIPMESTCALQQRSDGIDATHAGDSKAVRGLSAL